MTLVHRGAAMHHHVKYWILPDINNRIKNGEVTAYFSSSVTSIQKIRSSCLRRKEPLLWIMILSLP